MGALFIKVQEMSPLIYVEQGRQKNKGAEQRRYASQVYHAGPNNP